MEVTAIERCRLCQCSSLETVFDFGVQALSTRFPGPDDADAERVPLTLAQCGDCGLVQLTHDYDPDDLYRRGYGYRSGVNQTMRDHLGGIVAQLESRVRLQPGDTVLDIASNDGTLLHAYAAAGITRIGIDPTVAQYGEHYGSDMITSANFFSADEFRSLSPTPKARLISSIAVFYDVPVPGKFVADVAEILADDGVWVIEQSYLPLLIRDLAFDSICHEHLGYYGLKQISRIAEEHGLRVFDLETNGMNGGSIRAFMCHRDAGYAPNTERIEQTLRDEHEAGLDDPDTFKAFHGRIMELGSRLKTLLTEEHAKGKTIHIYGASTKGNVLLQLFDLDAALIDAAAERNEWKWGHRTPGTNIPIISEADSRAANPDYFLVLPWHFRDEFVAREADYIANGGKLIFPLPELEVYPAT